VSSDFHEILYTAADFELDERHVIKNDKVALDELRVRQNVFLVYLISIIHPSILYLSNASKHIKDKYLISVAHSWTPRVCFCGKHKFHWRPYRKCHLLECLVYTFECFRSQEQCCTKVALGYITRWVSSELLVRWQWKSSSSTCSKRRNWFTSKHVDCSCVVLFVVLNNSSTTTIDTWTTSSRSVFSRRR